jgi:hypothetical protein
MNELVQRLKLQAGINDNPDQEGLDLFAELIVRECALVVHKKTGPKSALNVLDHFGIKE